jgi:hypothetical protein
MGVIYFKTLMINPNLFSIEELTDKVRRGIIDINRIPEPEYRRIKERIAGMRKQYQNDFRFN